MPESMNKVGLLAEFESTAAILHAATVVRDAGYRRWDVFTPFPVHGMDEAMGLGNSLVEGRLVQLHRWRDRFHDGDADDLVDERF